MRFNGRFASMATGYTPGSPMVPVYISTSATVVFTSGSGTGSAAINNGNRCSVVFHFSGGATATYHYLATQNSDGPGYWSMASNDGLTGQGGYYLHFAEHDADDVDQSAGLAAAQAATSVVITDLTTGGSLTATIAAGGHNSSDHYYYVQSDYKLATLTVTARQRASSAGGTYSIGDQAPGAMDWIDGFGFGGDSWSRINSTSGFLGRSYNGSIAADGGTTLEFRQQSMGVAVTQPNFDDSQLWATADAMTVDFVNGNAEVDNPVTSASVNFVQGIDAVAGLQDGEPCTIDFGGGNAWTYYFDAATSGAPSGSGKFVLASDDPTVGLGGIALNLTYHDADDQDHTDFIQAINSATAVTITGQTSGCTFSRNVQFNQDDGDYANLASSTQPTDYQGVTGTSATLTIQADSSASGATGNFSLDNGSTWLGVGDNVTLSGWSRTAGSTYLNSIGTPVVLTYGTPGSGAPDPTGNFKDHYDGTNGVYTITPATAATVTLTPASPGGWSGSYHIYSGDSGNNTFGPDDTPGNLTGGLDGWQQQSGTSYNAGAMQFAYSTPGPTENRFDVNEYGLYKVATPATSATQVIAIDKNGAREPNGGSLLLNGNELQYNDSIGLAGWTSDISGTSVAVRNGSAVTLTQNDPGNDPGPMTLDASGLTMSPALSAKLLQRMVAAAST